VYLVGADLALTFIVNTDFRGAILLGADFSRSNRTNANYAGATMPDGTVNP